MSDRKKWNVDAGEEIGAYEIETEFSKDAAYLWTIRHARHCHGSEFDLVISEKPGGAKEVFHVSTNWVPDIQIRDTGVVHDAVLSYMVAQAPAGVGVQIFAKSPYEAAAAWGQAHKHLLPEHEPVSLNVLLNNTLVGEFSLRTTMQQADVTVKYAGIRP